MSSMVALIIPTYNAGPDFEHFLASVLCQTFQPDLLLMDSESSDATASLARQAGFTVHGILRSEFSHGATRQKGVDLSSDAEILIFMTQDAILASPDSIRNLLRCFDDPTVGAVCGRQLPHQNATPIAAHARLFNYPGTSSVRSSSDIAHYGIKTAFISNSFAAYRRSALSAVGGFPADVIFGEDTVAVTKMLKNGWKTAYCAEAACFHSHNYTVLQDLHRYFDVGVFHCREPWFLESLGKAEGEGKRFVLSELSYIARRAPWLIPSALLRTTLKLLGYRLGQKESSLPLWLKRRLSMNTGYWKST